jgi:Bacterial aa3 type cytochrome c oxidase subunit IV
MAMDAEVERHRQGWVGFTRFLKIGTAAVIILLILMAIFLL